ncbi:hypothetical protein Efla_003442 [Eimeria flavescens]
MSSDPGRQALADSQADSVEAILAAGGVEEPLAEAASADGQDAAAAAEGFAEAAAEGDNAKATEEAAEAADCLLSEESIRAAIHKLCTHRAACSQRGRYAEAQTAHEQIGELQAYLLAVKQQQTRSAHLLQQAAVEHAHYVEINRLTSAWPARATRACPSLSGRLHEELRRRQLDEAARQLEADILALRPRMLHASNSLLKLRQHQSLQAKAHKYEAAARLKVAADRLERDELSCWRQQRAAVLARRFCQLQQQQRCERDSLETRLAAARQQLGSLHADALHQLRRRYLYLKNHTARFLLKAPAAAAAAAAAEQALPRSAAVAKLAVYAIPAAAAAAASSAAELAAAIADAAASSVEAAEKALAACRRARAIRAAPAPRVVLLLVLRC